jgi:hypothetical protein
MRQHHEQAILPTLQQAASGSAPRAGGLGATQSSLRRLRKLVDVDFAEFQYIQVSTNGAFGGHNRYQCAFILRDLTRETYLP